jgi:hypothetical protein
MAELVVCVTVKDGSRWTIAAYQVEAEGGDRK